MNFDMMGYSLIQKLINDLEASGIQSLQGKSAYQYAVNKGYSGTEDEFAALMKECESIPDMKEQLYVNDTRDNLYSLSGTRMHGILTSDHWYISTPILNREMNVFLNGTISSQRNGHILFYAAENEDSYLSELELTEGTYTNYHIDFPDNATHFAIVIHRLNDLLRITRHIPIRKFAETNIVADSNTKIFWTACGDSITYGDNSYVSYIANKYKTVKAAKAADHTHTMKYALNEWEFDEIPKETTLITVMLGSYDIANGDFRGDVDTVMDIAPSDLSNDNSSFESFRLFIERCRTAFPGVPVYYIAPLRREPNQSEWLEECRKLCHRLAVPYLDANNESGIQFQDPVYTSDGINPNEAGVKLLARWLMSKINFGAVY